MSYIVYPKDDPRRSDALIPHKSEVIEYYGEVFFKSDYYRNPVKVMFVHMVPIKFNGVIHYCHPSFLKEKLPDESPET